jgi:hypothetical protein
MSSSRIYQCLEQVSCNVTARGKVVLRNSMVGLTAGAGAALGGISVGFHDVKLRDDGIRNFEHDHYNEYPEQCWTDTKKNVHCSRPGLSSASSSYGLQYAKDGIAEVYPWIMVGCTAGLAVVGLFAGAIRGWRKELPAAITHDIESQTGNYNRM